MVLDIVLIILGFMALVVGLIGAVLPLPGPPLSLFGLLLLHWSSKVEFSSGFWTTMVILTLVVTALDYIVPAWGVKTFGGSKAGIWGSTLGLLAGLALGPWGIFIGAFVGGLVGEMLAGQNSAKATKAAFGSFIGFLFGVLLKVVLCMTMLWYALAALFSSRFF